MKVKTELVIDMEDTLSVRLSTWGEDDSTDAGLFINQDDNSVFIPAKDAGAFANKLLEYIATEGVR